MTTQQDYPFIRAYGQAKNLSQSEIDRQVQMAQEEGVSSQAVWKQGNSWQTFDTITDETLKKQLQDHLTT